MRGGGRPSLYAALPIVRYCAYRDDEGDTACFRCGRIVKPKVRP